MNSLDLFVIAFYACGLIAMGSVFARKMKDRREMFAAGGQSPWWLSGLSAFMTMFSAGTFVVWGGISYRYGLVGTSICMTFGISAFLTGKFFAAHWKKCGVDSAAEFLELRFGRSLVQFYTWLQGTLGIFGMGGSVYALSVIICALVPLPVGHPLANPETGTLSVAFVSVAICLMVVLISFIGGLWAVLMTDALQFIILSVSVTLVVPLLFLRIGGPAQFIEKAPEGFLNPVAADFTWGFLFMWTMIHMFKIGGEWAYIQRFTCVPTPTDAKKSAYLFGTMYLISPLIWMLPPMMYRLINPDADFEQAYILACQAVLPAGLVGLIIAAMSSATASMVTTQLNVFAGAFTDMVYKELLRPEAEERELVRAGRVITILLGGVVMAGATLIPRMGGYTNYTLVFASLLTGPLVIPTIWGLFSRKLGLGGAWGVTFASAGIGLVAKFGFGDGGWFEGQGWSAGLSRILQENSRVSEGAIGVFVPLLLLLVIELCSREEAPGWSRLLEARGRHDASEAAPPLASTLPAKLCGIAVACIAVLMVGLAFVNREEAPTLVLFAAVLGLIAGIVLWTSRKPELLDPTA